MHEFTSSGYTGYYDDSCARLNAFLNSRLVRGGEHEGGRKTPSTSTLCLVGRPAAEELASLQQASGKLHVEAWAGCRRSLGLKICQGKEIQPRCAVPVFLPLPLFSLLCYLGQAGKLGV